MFVIVVVVAGWAWHRHTSTSKSTNNASANNPHYTHIDIKLQNGKLVAPEANYLVQPGIGLEFSVTSDKLGKIGVPTDPPQTITFTQSPVVFHFTVGNKPSTYPLTYQADGSKDVIEIGAITVRAAK